MEMIECDILLMEQGCSILVFFFCYSFLCRLIIMTMLIYIYIVTEINYGLLVMFDT